VAPQATICSIVETHKPHDIGKLMSKSARFCWELMFTRPMFRTADRERQAEILHNVASLIDEGRIVTTVSETLKGLSARNLREAHRRLESRKVVGKITIEV
jgi:NADPH:quinone reductase-like Zn-dependent oxidoreductase